jgi:hypothetical protein
MKTGLLCAAAALLALAALALAGCAGGGAPSGDAASGYSTDERPMDSIALIDRAVGEGLLDYSTGMLYKVYAVFEPMSLPQEYRSDGPLTARASLVSEVQRNWNQLSPEDRAEIENYIEPPGEMDRTDTELDDVTPDRLEDERNRID